MQEYENELPDDFDWPMEYTPDFQEAMDDLAEYRESKNMLNRMKTVDFRKEIVDGCTYSTPDLKTTHDENCHCSYCDPSAPIILSDQTKDDREVHDVKHGEHCGCTYCRGDRLGTVDAENVSLKQFSSKAEEREYLKQQEEKYINDPSRKFIKGDLPTDTKSFTDMFSVWKKNLAEELEKEYTVASKKDLDAIALTSDSYDFTSKLRNDAIDSQLKSVIHSHSNNGAPYCESDCCGPGHISHGILGDFFEDKSVQNLGEIDDAVYLKNKAAAKKKIISPQRQVEESWKSQLKEARNGRIPWSQPKTKLVIVYVGKSSKSKWDKIINECKPVFTEVQEAMPQCMVIYVPDVGAQEGQIRVETHDLS